MKCWQSVTPPFSGNCYDYFMSLKKNKRTVVLVTHDMGAVRQYCDRAIMIELGKIVEVGTPERVAQAYQKLFSDEAINARHLDNAENRWGSGEVVAEPPRIQVDKDFVKIDTQFIANDPVPAPIYGFSIYNGAGELITDSNTRKLKMKTTELKAKDKFGITWNIPNIFTRG
jgi:ABC-2 type transport system ATP-binding protein